MEVKEVEQQQQPITDEVVNNNSTDSTTVNDTPDVLQIGDGATWGRLVSLNPIYPSIELRQNVVIFGRTPALCQVTFNTPTVSGKHAKIHRDPTAKQNIVFLEDTSTNGTFINKELIGKGSKILVSNGCEISIIPKQGPERISYIYQDCSEEKAEIDQGGPQPYYDLREVLGTGNFATVRLAVHKETGQKYALKVIDKKKMSMTSKRKDALMDEVNVLTKVKNENIISIKEVFETNKNLYLVLELGIAHRDLKPENILLARPDSFVIKISDFGLSRALDEGSYMKTMCGTPQYVAPEILTKGEREGYGKSVDLWSIGVIMYILLCGFPPFGDPSDAHFFDKVKRGGFSFPSPYWDGISDEAKELIKSLILVDVEKRLTIDQALAHSWFANHVDDLDKINVKKEQSSQQSSSQQQQQAEEKEKEKENENEQEKQQQQQEVVIAQAETAEDKSAGNDESLADMSMTSDRGDNEDKTNSITTNENNNDLEVEDLIPKNQNQKRTLSENSVDQDEKELKRVRQ
ncbi:protein kinase 1 [Heterostelium album PN500]|uniref:Protein kinase 1 n=1 Tax=Heterostelium pallidum (strain ATCC 26659 / Pp 5 / PN500) TaxID=670386 RepID=D3B373_HETP5|nr:protein kinase 1 [Heterostelium album PN500]EFA83771.1 protein kinase 1 [Heterostelium album PN500]|eukprot:XP_020435888.1 protein kinase 1 [Heterostelium album PN500]